MSYTRRMQWAVAVSLVFHIVALAMSGMVPARRGFGPGDKPRPPLVLNLQPDEPQPRRQLIEPGLPAERPVADTNLISDRDSNAQDPQDVEGKVRAPLGDERNESYSLGGPPVPTLPPEPPREAAPQKEPPKPDPKEKKPEPAPKQPREKPLDKPVAVAKVEPVKLPPAPEEPPAEKPAPKPEAVAEAEKPALLPVGPKPGKFRGRLEGGIKGKGVLGFEAMKDDLAPYLLEVQRRVERHWNLAMGLTYTGTTRTKAVLDCTIGPDGRVVSVEVVNPGNSPTFAPICKESIEKAGPFPPFPFKVPDIYRDKNLEIRWTFNFM